MIKITNGKKVLFTLVSLWILYTIFYEYFIYSHHTILAGIFSLMGQAGLDLFIASMACVLWRKSVASDRYFFMLISISFFTAFLSDTSYNILVNIISVNLTRLTDSLFDIPFAVFLFLQAIAWFMLFNSVEQFKKTNFFCYVPYLIAATIIFGVFVFGFKWKVNYFSLMGGYQLIDTLLEAIGFIFASFCLSRAKELWVKYLSIGYLFIIGSDFVIRYSVIQKNIIPGNLMETFWVLGLMLIVLGFFYPESKQNIGEQNSPVLTAFNLKFQYGFLLFF